MKRKVDKKAKSSLLRGFLKMLCILSIILVAVIGIAGYAFLWYDGVVGATGGSNNQLDQTWLIIAMVSITIVVVGIAMISMAFVQIPMVLNYFYYGFIDNIKLSFYMAFKYFITTLIEVIVMAASVILLINALFLYHLLPLWLFFGISVPLYIDYIISQRFYRYVSGQTEDDEEESLQVIEEPKKEEPKEEKALTVKPKGFMLIVQ